MIIRGQGSMANGIILGCMTYYATNYNPQATVNGGCIFEDKSSEVLVVENSQELINGHGIYVKECIDIGYGSTVEADIVGTGFMDGLDRCIDMGYRAMVHSYESQNFYHTDLAEVYPSLQAFMPVGSNIFTEISRAMGVVICCGAGTTENITAYGNSLEFWDFENVGSIAVQSSLSNGVVAGKIMKIKDTLDCSFWEARYRARITADRNEARRPANTLWTRFDGFGKINTQAAIDFVGVIPIDPFLNNLNVYTPYIPV